MLFIFDFLGQWVPITFDKMNKVTVVIGAQWGDEGKGKIVDMLAQDANIVCRCQVIFNYK